MQKMEMMRKKIPYKLFHFKQFHTSVIPISI